MPLAGRCSIVVKALCHWFVDAGTVGMRDIVGSCRRFDALALGNDVFSVIEKPLRPRRLCESDPCAHGVIAH